MNNKRNIIFCIVVIVCMLLIAICSQATELISNTSTNDTTENTPEALESSASDNPQPKSQTVTLSFAGDCTLGTDVNFSSETSFNAMYESVDDPSWFFANVFDIFNNDDFTIVNMEGTLTDRGTRQDKTYAFKGEPAYAQVLVAGDVQAACMANNHSKDYGDISYTDTIDALQDAGIATFGYEKIAYLEKDGIKIALIGTYELAEGIEIENEMLKNIVTAQESGAQIICVYAHWGVERETIPNEAQILLAHAAIDAGADVVVGSHPHVIQGYEKYHGRYIIYSLGNFCFGGNSNPTDKDCLIFQQTFTLNDDLKVAEDDCVEVIPCSVSSTDTYNDYQPTPATGSKAESILAKVAESNAAIKKLSAEISR